MSNETVKIQATGLPNIYPVSYTDKMFTHFEVEPIGLYEQVFVTKESFQTLNDSQFKPRTIQAILYKKYRLKIQANNSMLLEYYKHSEYLTILTKDGVTHKAKVLDLQREEISDTNLVWFTFEYADVNVNNYMNQQDPSANFLTYNTISNEFEDQQLIRYSISSTHTIDSELTGMNDGYIIYSKLLPKYTVSDIEKQEGETPTGLKVVTRGTIARTVTSRFYLTRTEANIIKKYSDISNDWTLYSNQFGFFQGLERPDIEIQEVDGANEIFECTVVLKYNNVDDYPLNT